MIELDQGGAGVAGSTRLPVPADLDEWVDAASAHRNGTSGWKIVADDAAYLILSECEGRAGTTFRLVLVGARSRAIEADLSDRRRTAFLRLHPGALAAVAGLPGRALANRGVPWSEVTGERGDRADPARLAAAWQEAGDDRVGEGRVGERRIGERPPGGPPGEDRRGADRRVLLALLDVIRGQVHRKGGLRRDWRVQALLAAEAHSAPVARAQRTAGVSPRTLHRAVREAVGLAPSSVLRIRRLHRALLDGLSRGKADSRLALRHGYSDQSHMIRDCRALMGETPTSFLGRASR